MFNGEFVNISSTGGLDAWSKNNIPNKTQKWKPRFRGFDFSDNVITNSAFVSYYDKANQEVLFINKDIAVAWNEKLQAFTSFYDYEKTPYLVSLDDKRVWLKASDPTSNSKIITVWEHQAGEECCNFFGERKPYWTTLVSNPEPQIDKLFTNLEFRACVEGDGVISGDSFVEPYLPFNNLEVWNEYQHGISVLQTANGHDYFSHYSSSDNNSSLKRKFRIWRCDVPRDNAIVGIRSEASRGISRAKSHPVSRMRNPWLYLTLKKDPIISYTCTKIPRAKGFIIPVSEFSAYKLETGEISCIIKATDNISHMAAVYLLIDMATSTVKYTFDTQTYNQVPLADMNITWLEGLASTYSGDALFIDCSSWMIDPSTIELTIGRTVMQRRMELHDMSMTYYK